MFLSLVRRQRSESGKEVALLHSSTVCTKKNLTGPVAHGLFHSHDSSADTHHAHELVGTHQDRPTDRPTGSPVNVCNTIHTHTHTHTNAHTPIKVTHP